MLIFCCIGKSAFYWHISFVEKFRELNESKSVNTFRIISVLSSYLSVLLFLLCSRCYCYSVKREFQQNCFRNAAAAKANTGFLTLMVSQFLEERNHYFSNTICCKQCIQTCVVKYALLVTGKIDLKYLLNGYRYNLD